MTRLEGHPIYVFNGIPKPEGWGDDLVYKARTSGTDRRTMGALGGLPVVDIWNASGGIAVFNTQTYQEPLTVNISYDDQGVTIEAHGASQIEIYKHVGDYYDAVRNFAVKMKAQGLSVQTAPDWAFDANWETYGYEEDFDLDTIRDKLPLLEQLGIKTITIDSGWYGRHRGEEYQFNTGDFALNPDIAGTEQDWRALVKKLHQRGFRVRLWWSPGVAERDSQLWVAHPEWFANPVISSTGETDDIYLRPSEVQVKNWNKTLIERFLSYGVDGFKQDDIYNYASKNPHDQIDYANLINSNLSTAQSIKPDFAINTCNCGLAQNFYLMPGQNQLITSDPVGSRQFRHRAKYLHALNVNGAAILGDHVELTRGDISIDDMDEPGFYNTVDFSSIVPLGMVLQTKFRDAPGNHYKHWFKIYNAYKFYRMEWVNIPLIQDRTESYLLRDGKQLYFSFFTQQDGSEFDGQIELINLTPKVEYHVYDIANDKNLGTFVSAGNSHQLKVKFIHSLVLRVSPST